MQRIVEWFSSLSNGLKVLLIILAVAVAVLASSPLAIIAGLAFVVGIVAIIVQAIRRRPIKQWGIATVSALLLSFILGGVANALYGSFAPQQQASISPPAATTELTAEPSVAQETTGSTATRRATHESKNPPPPPASLKQQIAASQTTPSRQSASQSQRSTTEDSYPHFSDGTLQLGKDIQPGTYRTRKGSSGCYYARLKGFSGELDDILANQNINAPAVVTITPTDASFESKRCGTWTQDLSQVTTSKTSFEDGTYIVGTDMEPGTYKNSGSKGCYYARLKGFSGELADIVANDNTDASTVVTIAPTDKGFDSHRCGTWTKIG